MEAYGDDEEIEVTATKEEWREVILWILRAGEPGDNPAGDLIYWLINQEVYENEGS